MNVTLDDGEFISGVNSKYWEDYRHSSSKLQEAGPGELMGKL